MTRDELLNWIECYRMDSATRKDIETAVDKYYSSQNSGKPLLGAVQSPIKEKYIITTEDGTHYVADNFDEEDIRAVEDGLLTIIRCSDAKQLDEGTGWVELPQTNIS